MTNRSHLTPSSDKARELADRGFGHHFALAEETILDLTENVHYVPEQVAIIEEHRNEGPTDPSDETVLLALRAPDGTLGTLITAYGQGAEHGDVLRRLGADHRA